MKLDVHNREQNAPVNISNPVAIIREQKKIIFLHLYIRIKAIRFLNSIQKPAL
jgi:hypothetical protein